jgi:hypothetical protein
MKHSATSAATPSIRLALKEGRRQRISRRRQGATCGRRQPKGQNASLLILALGCSRKRAADDLGRGQKLHAAGSQSAALASTFPENLLKRHRNQAGVRCASPSRAPAVSLCLP